MASRVARKSRTPSLGPTEESGPPTRLPRGIVSRIHRRAAAQSLEDRAFGPDQVGKVVERDFIVGLAEFLETAGAAALALAGHPGVEFRPGGGFDGSVRVVLSIQEADGFGCDRD